MRTSFAAPHKLNSASVFVVLAHGKRIGVAQSWSPADCLGRKTRCLPGGSTLDGRFVRADLRFRRTGAALWPGLREPKRRCIAQRNRGRPIQAILPDPALGASTIFAASPNGGIWVTYNAGGSWTPLTDKQASLSIASLGLDPTDPTGKTIIAGIGITDNGEYSKFNLGNYLGRGAAQTGLLYATNGGATWSSLGGSTLAGQSVIGVEARGSMILAATFEVQSATMSTAGYGLFRSMNGGATFTKVSGSGAGLPNGAVTSLVADPNDPSRFYAAVKQSANNAATGVYVSNDNGATWSAVLTAANSNGQITNGRQTSITLAAGPNGSVAVAISNLSASTPALTGFFYRATTVRPGTSSPRRPTWSRADRRLSTFTSRSIRPMRI
jgi:hypothetical protein